MPHTDSVNLCIEAICQSGCSTVRAVITSLEDGQTISQTNGMSQEEVSQVLNELKAVMSVYDQQQCQD